jgi:DNA repair exonuclease SbcCD ATPase subunit
MSKLETMSVSVELNHFPAGDVQDLLRDEIEKLRNDVLKYEDATAEYLKAQQSNEVLSKELNVEKLKSEKLDGRVKVLQQSEVHLKTQSAQLENELKTMKDMARDSASLPSELEREMENFRVELHRKESDLREAAAKAEAAEKLQEIRANEAAEWKVSSLRQISF